MNLQQMEKLIFGRNKITLKTIDDLKCYIQNFVVNEFLGEIFGFKVYDAVDNITTEVLFEIV